MGPCGRKISCATLFGALAIPLSTVSTTHGQERIIQELPAYYHPFELFGPREAPSRLEGFRKTRKELTQLPLGLLRKKLGKNYFTQKMAPILLSSAYQLFIPRRSGDIDLRQSGYFLDQTASNFLKSGKKDLSKWVDKVLPSPLAKNIVGDLLAGQNLRLSRGIPRYSMRLKKRVSPQFQFKNFLVSGGTQTWLSTKEFGGLTPVARFQYQNEDHRYGVSLLGARTTINIETKHLKTEVTVDPSRVKFSAELSWGAEPPLPEFPIEKYGKIKGVVFSDLNGDGLKGAEEPCLANLTVLLDQKNRLTVDAAGGFEFRNIPAGKHTVELETATLPPSHTVVSETRLVVNVRNHQTEIIQFSLMTPSRNEP